MKFDAHAHIVSRDTERYAPAPLGGRVRPGDLDDPITAERLIAALDANGVERALAVQRAYVYGYDNSYVLDAAASYPDRLRAVCAVDARLPDAARLVHHWVAERGAAGIRLTEPARNADTSWFDSAAALEVWTAAADLAIPVRLQLFRWNRAACLPAIAAVVRRFPHTPVVIDHLSNLSAEDGPPSYGLDAPLAALIEHDNLFLLLSTINLARLDAEQQPAAPVVEHLVAAFGAGRIMWGSDIGQSQGDYARMCALADAAVGGLSADARRQVLYATAHAIYG